MKLKYDPFPLIFTQGDEATKLACLDFFGLSDSPPAKECLLKLIKQQRSDGAFPSSLDPENWGTRETVRNTLLLLKVGLPPEGLNIDSAMRFILGHQHPDGGWSENPSLVIPPEKVELSNERGITWITADVVELLHQVGVGECPECKAALEWLRAMQNQHGGWYSYSGSIGDQRGSTGDPDSTAQITFLMGEIFGEDDPVYLRGRELFERHFDECAQDVERGYRIKLRDGERVGLDAYTLTHLLLSWLLDPPRRIQSGYDVSDPRVKQMMEALIEIQREDGGWRPFWSEEISPVYTALAVKVLILSGMLARDDLEGAVKAYAV
jgi:squalene cyclase